MLLASLHVSSPDFDPSWRMVSEYAFGHYGRVLSLMFLSLGTSSWALAVAIWSQVQTNSGKVGLWFLVVARIGEAMASAFDVTHVTGHGIAGLVGVGGFPVAALLVSVSLARTEAWSSAEKALLSIANSKLDKRPAPNVLAARSAWIGWLGQSDHCGFVLLVGVRRRSAGD